VTKHDKKHWDRVNGAPDYEDYDSFVGEWGKGWKFRIWRSLEEGEDQTWGLTLGPEYESDQKVLMRNGIVGSSEESDTLPLTDAEAEKLLQLPPEDALLFYYGHEADLAREFAVMVRDLTDTEILDVLEAENPGIVHADFSGNGYAVDVGGMDIDPEDPAITFPIGNLTLRDAVRAFLKLLWVAKGHRIPEGL
jgi:hypothetical protein